MSLVSILPLFVLGLFAAIFHVCDADISSSKYCVQQNGTVEKHVQVVAGNGTGPPLNFSLTQTYNSPGNWNATNGSAQSVQVGSYTLGAEQLYSFNITSNLNQSFTIVIHWGPAIEGSDVGIFYLQNGVVSGNIDGRSFLPFSLGNDNITVTFTDGGPSPMLHPTSNTTALVQTIHDQLPEEYPQCVPPPTAANFSSTVANFSSTISPRQAPGLDWTQNVAHATNFNDLDCFACRAEAGAVAAAGYAGCGFICGSIFLSWKCGSCISRVTNRLNNALSACQASTSCCKNRCGGIFSGCCGLGEVCFSPDVFNMCCYAGQQPCGAGLCCNPDQACTAGSCCPRPQLCRGNSLCCPAGQKCNNAGTACCSATDELSCCADQDKCGSVCCPRDAGLLGTRNCANNLCCYNSEINAGGLCCNPGESNCGGECCSGTCVNNGCVQTTQNCKARGGTGKTCTVSCNGLSTCRDGCCFERPK